MPYVVWAADHCTDPDKYTIDKRCYVTDEQKKETPFNAVVGIYGDYDISCTGTVVKQDDELYIYTARHCVKWDNGSLISRIVIKFQNGKDSVVELVAAGGDDDWAVYRLLPNYVKWGLSGKVRYQANENMEDTVDYVYARNNNDDFVKDFTAVGYGSLKIMSDKDIEDFRERYINYLKRQRVTITEENTLDYGLFEDGGIAMGDKSVQQFVYDNFIRWLFYTNAIFNDPKLKFSNCVGSQMCQVWNGDSGGPLFDAKNRLFGVRTRGYSIVGGGYHARSSDYVSTVYIYDSMKELKEMEPKVILIKDN